ncbi:Fasciclin-like arabinogalactan protein 11 [Linum grandiflorum]
MRSQLQSPFLFLFLFFFHCSAQSPAPGPSGPTNITAILEKAGQFTTLIKLMKTTQEADQINTQLNSSSTSGLTIFAPTDNAFSSLKSGTLNSLSDQQKVQLIQFHILPTFVSMSQFQTVSNPLRTQAGDSANGQFPLNVTTSGTQVNITTGVDTANVDNTLYTDGQLAVYQVSQVLLPLDLFGSSAAPAPAPAKAGKALTSKAPTAGNADDSPGDASGAEGRGVSIGLLGFAFAAAVLVL